MTFWHCDCVSSQSQKSFANKYEKWCHKTGYHYQSQKANEIYESASKSINTLPKSPNTKFLINESIQELNSLIDSLERIRKEMNRIASFLPEYPVVMGMYGVGTTLGPQLIAEIGNVRRFYSRKALIAYAGLAFGYILPTTGRIRDFHPLERALAGRTNINRSCQLSVDSFLSMCNYTINQSYNF